MRLKRSSSIVIFFDEGELMGINFLKKSYFKLNSETIEFLSYFNEWKTIQELSDQFKEHSYDSILRSIKKLIEIGALIVENTIEAVENSQYDLMWEWGPFAGLHHFLIKDLDYLSVEEGYEWLTKRAQQKPQPNQFSTNSDKAIPLPYPEMTGELFTTMLKRRSERKYLDKPISSQILSNILYCGFGITAMVDDNELGWLPLKMTPSGGARNPFEGYIAIRNVEGFEQGFYHYDGINKNLEKVSSSLPSRAKIVGNQEWADEASIVIFLVAVFERTMWKYPNPAAYRVVLIEAGHIVQNMMLAATKFELVATPTSAISNSQASGILNLNPISSSIIYTLSVGYPGKGFDTLY